MEQDEAAAVAGLPVSGDAPAKEKKEKRKHHKKHKKHKDRKKEVDVEAAQLANGSKRARDEGAESAPESGEIAGEPGQNAAGAAEAETASTLQDACEQAPARGAGSLEAMEPAKVPVIEVAAEPAGASGAASRRLERTDREKRHRRHRSGSADKRRRERGERSRSPQAKRRREADGLPAPHSKVHAGKAPVECALPGPPPRQNGAVAVEALAPPDPVQDVAAPEAAQPHVRRAVAVSAAPRWDAAADAEQHKRKSQRPRSSERSRGDSARRRERSREPRGAVARDAARRDGVRGASRDRGANQDRRERSGERRDAVRSDGRDAAREPPRGLANEPWLARDRPGTRDPRDDRRHADPARGSYDRLARPEGALRERGDRDRDTRDRYDRDRGGSRDRRSERERERDRERGRDSGGRRKRDERSREQQVEDAAVDEQLAAKLEEALNGGEDAEARLIEERRRRRQAILDRHRSQERLSEMVAAPTASELGAGSSAGDLASRGAPASVPASPAGLGSELEPGAAARPASAGESRPASLAPSRAPSRAASPEGKSTGVMVSGGGSAAGTVAGLARPDSTGELLRMGGDSGSDEDGGGAAQALTHGAELWQTRRDAAVAAASAAEPTEGAHEGAAPAGGGEGAASRPATDRDSASEEARRVAVQAARPPVEGFDMFADQEDGDMFGATPSGGKAGGAAPAGAARRGLLDNYDDAEGYYNFQVGELMDGRYEVFATHGKGVFSTVLRARDRGARADAAGAFPEVAVKVIRANDIMFKAGQTETVILRKLSGADPEGKRHCVRLLRTFEYRHHLCLVFESMDINLRELTKKYGRGIGLNIGAVRAYAAQLLTALYHLRNCGVIHADIKPDNILVAASRTYLKLCDFGSAMFDGENELTPYLVSRFYRAPEVILGLKYGVALDTWSIGAVIYELYTGRILFPGRTNNEMLKLMMDAKGAFPKKMLRRAAFAEKHFEDDVNMSFRLWEEDPVCRLVSNPTVKRDFAALLAGGEGDRRQVAALADLLERLTALDPDRRLSPKEALRHPFIKGDKDAKR